jgi:hypothetical protein
METKYGRIPNHTGYLRGVWKLMEKRHKEASGEEVSAATLRARVKAGDPDAWILYEATVAEMLVKKDSITGIVQKHITQSQGQQCQ